MGMHDKMIHHTLKSGLGHLCSTRVLSTYTSNTAQDYLRTNTKTLSWTPKPSLPPQHLPSHRLEYVRRAAARLGAIPSDGRAVRDEALLALSERGVRHAAHEGRAEDLGRRAWPKMRGVLRMLHDALDFVKLCVQLLTILKFWRARLMSAEDDQRQIEAASHHLPEGRSLDCAPMRRRAICRRGAV